MTTQNNSAFPLMISVVVMDPTQLASVYALLGGTAIAVAQGKPPESAKPAIAAASEPSGSGDETASSSTSSTATTDASPSDEIDAHGHPWSPELHASTKGKTKDGLWRMKVGVTRPDPLPGFPADSGAPSAATGTSSGAPAPSATLPAATDAANAPAATSGEEDDEFAAFRNAAAASDAADAAAVANVPARAYSDADLGALCNQAAVKLGDPAPIKEIIAQYVPDGQVAHSRNIPEASRAQFVQDVETKAGIEFVG